MQIAFSYGWVRFIPLTLTLSPKGRGNLNTLSPLGRGQGEGKMLVSSGGGSSSAPYSPYTDSGGIPQTGGGW